jgi:hypothetical protein
MNWAMPPRIKSRIATATVAAALIAISGLIVPPQAFATPTPLSAPDCADARRSDRDFWTNDTSFDDPRCARRPFSVNRGDDFDWDDDDDWYNYYNNNNY